MQSDDVSRRCQANEGIDFILLCFYIFRIIKYKAFVEAQIEHLRNVVVQYAFTLLDPSDMSVLNETEIRVEYFVTGGRYEWDCRRLVFRNKALEDHIYTHDRFSGIRFALCHLYLGRQADASDGLVGVVLESQRKS